MSLRRSALGRRSELRRTPLQQTKPMARARAVRAQVAKARRDTGPTRVQRDVVEDRAMGCCEMCGVPLIAWSHTGARTSYQPHSIHHRQPRGMGGTSRLEINSPANLLLVCGTGTSGCHGWIESNRTEAYTFGLLVGAGADTAAVPLLLEGGDWYFHDHDGGRRPDPRWRPA